MVSDHTVRTTKPETLEVVELRDLFYKPIYQAIQTYAKFEFNRYLTRWKPVSEST